MSCRDSPGLQKFRPGSILNACLQTLEGQNLGGPRTLFISKDLTAVSLTGALEGQAAAKGCIPGETVALQVLASCPTFLCELCDPPRGTLCGQFTAPPEQS